jgi:hypothetical protein
VTDRRTPTSFEHRLDSGGVAFVLHKGGAERKAQRAAGSPGRTIMPQTRPPDQTPSPPADRTPRPDAERPDGKKSEHVNVEVESGPVTREDRDDPLPEAP